MKRTFAALCLLLLFFIVFYPFQQVIAFTFENENRLLAYLPVESGATFHIQYTHSIHLSDVRETYQIESQQITQTELTYKHFAVGMPSNAEENEVFEKRGDLYVISNMNRRFPFIDLRTGQVRADHKIIYENHTYVLADSIKPGTWIRIAPQKLSLWAQLKGVKLK